ncbi:MAG TPA: 3-hydroxyacyl-CoA dehydrogenase NAD-binding domain-containing protein [Stellaceae bacterium]|jgi:3-hydroxyacyl-CoA dehydrogenase|nr:3-hydroxyacyl-CoA dehydrogenase NAD-binding domain-containing protein [Stellaceae bacterium]
MAAGEPLVKTDQIGKVALLTIDNPPVNATSHALRSALKAALEAAIADPAAAAIVLIGAGRGFIAGADITEFERKREEPLNPANIAVMEQSPKPIVAAIHGHALGGGLELAMGCHYRVTTPDAKLGQPEVKIGITPGAGGTQRLPRLVGLPLALDMIVGGDPIDAKLALDQKLIDEIVTGDLRAGALAFAERISDKRPLPRVRDLPPPALPVADFFATARTDTAKRKPGLNAPLACIDALEASLLPIEEGLRREREIFGGTVFSDQARALRYIFFAEREAAKVPGIDADTPVKAIASVGVIGGGTMGAAITLCCLDAGLPVTLVEADKFTLDRALATMRTHYDGQEKRGRLRPGEMEKRLARLTGSMLLGDLGAADLIIEAVTEDLTLKHKIFGELGLIAKPDALMASNTSYLDINLLAEASQRAESVLGLHFFAPATIMRVMEIVCAAQTAPSAIASGMAFGRKIRKLPVAVAACDGFVGNRLLAQRGREVERLLAEGVAIEAIDRAMTEFGFPVGPCAAGDIAGLDISYRARKQRGRSWPLADAIVDAGRLGQKTGAGYYRYDSGSRTPLPDPAAQRIIDLARGSDRRVDLPSDEIALRMLSAMINEGARILDEGIAARASDIDVIWVYGYGFPAHRGGPMFYADLIGLAKLCERLSAAAKKFGDDSLKPVPLLAKLAADGKTFRTYKP